MPEEQRGSLWQRYRAEYKKQNARPLPVWRFWLSSSLLLMVFFLSLLLGVESDKAAVLLFLPITLIVALFVYEKRPEQYRG